MKGVMYLEEGDINPDGTIAESIVNYIGRRPSLLFIHGDFCPHCTTVKPEYEKVANALQGKVAAFAVKTDGSESERALRPVLGNVPGFSGGVPYIVAMDANGRAIAPFSGKRDAPTIIEFAEKYCTPPQPL